jgi:CRISPR-associated protein Cmr1
MQSLNHVGETMKSFRDWNAYKQDRPADHLFFPADHDLMLSVVQGEKVAAHPKRVIFGLPSPYFFSSELKKLQQAGDNYAASKAKATVSVDKKSHSRRASPLFIHIHTFPDGKSVAVQTLLAADFLHDGMRLRLGSSRVEDFSLPVEPDWGILHSYLDSFSNAIEVLPEVRQ